MARTPSNTDLPLGSHCPDFMLPDAVTGRLIHRDSLFKDTAGLLVAFVCVHCPFVQHMEEALASVARGYAGRVATVAVMSNDTDAHPEDAPEHMRTQAVRLGWDFPYLLDLSQDTAHAFHAACTPDLYLFDAKQALVYHAQFDETRPYRQSDAERGMERDPRIHQAAHGADLRRAIDGMLAGEAPLEVQTAGLGCNLKWKPGS